MVLGISPKELIALIGHDGKEVTNPKEEEPLCYRGFHIQELIVACLKMDVAVVQVEVLPFYEVDNEKRIIDEPAVLQQQFTERLQSQNGILLGFGFNQIPHAVAWDRETHQIFDPAGKVYPLTESESNHFTDIHTLLALYRIKSVF